MAWGVRAHGSGFRVWMTVPKARQIGDLTDTPLKRSAVFYASSLDEAKRLAVELGIVEDLERAIFPPDPLAEERSALRVRATAALDDPQYGPKAKRCITENLVAASIWHKPARMFDRYRETTGLDDPESKHRYVISAFDQWLGGDADKSLVHAVTPQVAAEYVCYLIDLGTSTGNKIKKRISHLSRMWKWLKNDLRATDTNPWPRVRKLFISGRLKAEQDGEQLSP